MLRSGAHLTVTALVDHLGIGDFHLVGVSMGGRIALELAIAALDLREHVVEAAHQEAELVAAVLAFADRVAIGAGDAPHRLDEPEDRTGQDALEPRRQAEGDGTGEEGGDRECGRAPVLSAGAPRFTAA